MSSARSIGLSTVASHTRICSRVGLRFDLDLLAMLEMIVERCGYQQVSHLVHASGRAALSRRRPLLAVLLRADHVLEYRRASVSSGS